MRKSNFIKDVFNFIKNKQPFDDVRLKDNSADLAYNKDKKRGIVFLLLFWLLFTLLISTFYLFDFPYLNIKFSSLDVGMIATRDIIAEDSFEYIDKAKTAEKISTSQNIIKPLYYVNNKISQEAISKFESFKNFTRASVESKKSFEEYNKSILESYKLEYNLDFLKHLYNNPNSFYIKLDISSRVFKELLNRGVVRLNVEDFSDISSIVICRWNDNKQFINEDVEIDKVSTLDNYAEKAAAELTLRGLKEVDVNDILTIISPFMVENSFFNAKETLAVKNKLELQFEPVLGTVKKGDYIIKKGFQITENQMDIIRHLKNRSRSISLKNFLGLFFYLLIVIVISYIIFDKKFINVDFTANKILLVLLLFLFLMIIYIFFKMMNFFHGTIPIGLFIPSGLVGLIIAIFCSPSAAIFFTSLLSVSFLLFFDVDVFSLVFIFLTGIFASLSTQSIKNRRDILKAGFILTIFQLILVFSMSLLKDQPIINILIFLMYSAINGGLSTFIAFGFIPLFEYLFNLSTVFRYLEYIDLSLPIFKELSRKAPGTFAHTLQVANLAEVASSDIGCNSILAKAGALYHDIGKMDSASYFAENLNNLESKTFITNKMAATTIKSHVSKGVKIANDLKLPKEIIDIIEQHHGTGIITYFYIQALNDKNLKSIPQESEYSYLNKLPQTKEAAIVMLADIAEAASRSLQVVTESSLERLIDRIVSDKIEHGQLDDCNLTFTELKIIKESLIRSIVSGMHSRPKYPGQEKNDKENKDEIEEKSKSNLEGISNE